MTNPELREERKEYKIREAVFADAEAIAHIQYNAWLATYPNEKAGITEGDIRIYLGDQERGVERWKQNLKQASKEVKAFIAEDSGRVVGFCAVAKKERENRLNALYLDLAYQGKGAASQLLKQAMKFFDEDSPVTLEVAAYNERAKLFYERHGFQEVQRVTDPDRINEKEMEIIVMRHPNK